MATIGKVTFTPGEELITLSEVAQLAGIKLPTARAYHCDRRYGFPGYVSKSGATLLFGKVEATRWAIRHRATYGKT